MMEKARVTFAFFSLPLMADISRVTWAYMQLPEFDPSVAGSVNEWIIRQRRKGLRVR